MPDQTRSTPEFALRLQDVALGYGDFTVLRGISMEVRSGQVVAIMGGSGSGKTTLLRAATGQLVAQQGTVLAFGQDIARATRAELQSLRKRMGVLFQQGALFTDLNVFENVAFRCASTPGWPNPRSPPACWTSSTPSACAPPPT